jgi:hypothetical protein
MKIGDKVKINKKTVLKYIGNIPDWYTTEIYTICSISGEVMCVDKILTGYTNQIHKQYLIKLTEIRREKLRKLNKISKTT